MRVLVLLLITSLLVIAADTFEEVESSSVYMERINENGTITAINITRNGDIILTIKGVSYIGHIENHELRWLRDWQGEAE